MKPIHLIAFMFLTPISVHSREVAGFTPDREVVYKHVDNTELKLHIFDPPDLAVSDQRSAIVFFFGGGWKGGSPSQFYPHCKYLASRGMVAMAADYRVQSRNQTSPRECVKDGKSAIRWIRRHADEFGIDPDQVVAGGGSAGGHVAAATGTTASFNEDGEDQRLSCIPNALVLFNPVFDNGPEGYGYERVKEYWNEISPMHNINASTPPTIVFLGTKDKLIPVQTAQQFQQRMADQGRRCDLQLYEDQVHGFFNHRNKENYTKTVVEMDRFLESLGYLKAEPTLH
jgi:acetyl esterase/lipase